MSNFGSGQLQKGDRSSIAGRIDDVTSPMGKDRDQSGVKSNQNVGEIELSGQDYKKLNNVKRNLTLAENKTKVEPKNDLTPNSDRPLDFPFRQPSPAGSEHTILQNVQPRGLEERSNAKKEILPKSLQLEMDNQLKELKTYADELKQQPQKKFTYILSLIHI